MFTMELPRVAVKSTLVNPRKLFIFSQPKCGKTSAVLQLPNNLVIDLEGWSSYYDWLKIDVRDYALRNSMSTRKAFSELIWSLRESKASGFVYDYITIDTISAMEDIALELALDLYKDSPVGKNYKWTNVLNLPQGAWYWWLREAFEKIYNSFDGLYEKWLIIVWHPKTSSITKGWEDITIKDINLTGKQKFILTADCDAIWYMSRDTENPNVNVIQFGIDDSIIGGSRCPHLSNTSFILSEMIDWNLVTYRDRIFLT